jgi:hypothetical protein
MNRLRDFARRNVRAALGLERAGLAVQTAIWSARSKSQRGRLGGGAASAARRIKQAGKEIGSLTNQRFSRMKGLAPPGK